MNLLPKYIGIRTHKLTRYQQRIVALGSQGLKTPYKSWRRGFNNVPHKFLVECRGGF